MGATIARLLIISGIILVIMGVIIMLSGKFPNIGRLPGDILIKRENFTFYFPITTCILASLVLSLIFYIFFKK